MAVEVSPSSIPLSLTHRILILEEVRSQFQEEAVSLLLVFAEGRRYRL